MDSLTDDETLAILKGVDLQEREALLGYVADEVVALVDALTSVFEADEGLDRNLARLPITNVEPRLISLITLCYV